MTDVKKSAFAFISIVVVPLLFFALVELGLKIVGVGTSYDYFHEIDIAGETHFQENPDFADQFYPPALNIGPVENTFAEARDPDLVRVYILGGSAAMGFPHQNHGLDRLLAAQLRAALPTKTVEVINTAMTSVNSHVVYQVAKTIPNNSADFAVILMGNNEVVGPYGPGTFNQNFLANLSLIRGIQALKRTRTWQGLDGLLGQVKASDAKDELEWEGMQMFTNHGVAHDDPRMESVYSHYEDNLIDTIASLQDKGMHVVLSSVPVNLRHSAPFLSVHGSSLSEEQIQQWRALDSAASASLTREEWTEAVKDYQAALEVDPDYADTHFGLATALEHLGDFSQAKSHFEHALDLDGLRFRADSKINTIIQTVATNTDSGELSFVDSAAAFEHASRPFQPGWNLLLEHVHYDFSGNHVLAAAMSSSIVSNLNASDNARSLSATEVAERIGFPNYDTIEEIKNLQGMIEHPPFPGQSNYAQLEDFLSNKIERITNNVGSQAAVVQKRQAVVSSGVADWKLHFELAVINQRLRNPTAMHFHLKQILELYPHNRETYMKIAEASSREGRWRDVIPHLERSLSYTRGDEEKIAETINWLGTAYLRIGDYENAKDRLLEVAKEFPDQIDLAIKAYANLIRYAREQNKDDDLQRFVEDVQAYANRLIRNGKDEDYPLLYERMSQVMGLGGYTTEAKEWAEAKPQ